MEVDKIVLESALQEFKGQRISRIISIEQTPAVPKGENYVSEILRLTVTMSLIGGETVNKTFIYKGLLKTEKHEFMKAVYEKEKNVFGDVLPTLEIIRHTHETGGEPLWAECFGPCGHNGLLLEDLNNLGYRTAGERCGLDFDHCAIVMKSLAKLHALAAVLAERGDLRIDNYKWHYEQESRREGLSVMFDKNFDAVAWILEEKWKGEWALYASALRGRGKSIGGEILQRIFEDEPKFKTLNHGDCWMKNMLFRYDDDGRVLAVRFVDFQLTFYNGPGYDIEYFLWTSPHTEVRPRKRELYEIYYKELCSSLKKFEFSSKLPTFEDICHECEKAKLYAFATSLSWLPFMMVPQEAAPDPNKIFSNSEDRYIFIDKWKDEGEDYRRTMQHILGEAKEIGLF